MEAQSDLLLVLALILVAGKLASHLGQRVGLPTAVAKICVGLAIGPAALGFVSDGGTLEAFSTIGVILLMFLAGLETDMATMRRVSLPAFAVAVGGVLLPFLGGVGIGYAFGLEATETLFLGAILTATSVSISAQTLRELGRLQSRAGTTILAAAVIDDVLGIVVLAFVFSLAGDGDPVVAIGKMLAFLPLAYLAGRAISGGLGPRIHAHLSEDAQLAVAIAAALALAWAAEHLGGVAAVTGAYMAGLLIVQTPLGERVTHGLNWVGYSFFVPLFFVAIGLKADFASLGEAPWLVVALIGVAVAGKVIGCYAGARVGRFGHRESVTVGIGMMSRGEVALVIAAAGLDAGVVEGSIFSAAVLMTLTTTLLTPILLKLWTGREEEPEAALAPFAAALPALDS